MKAKDFLFEDNGHIEKLDKNMAEIIDAIEYFKQHGDMHDVQELENYYKRLKREKELAMEPDPTGEHTPLFIESLNEYKTVERLLQSRRLASASEKFNNTVNAGDDSNNAIQSVAQEYGLSPRMFQDYLVKKGIVSDSPEHQYLG